MGGFFRRKAWTRNERVFAGGAQVMAAELIGGDVNHREFVNTYMRLLGTGLSILGEGSYLTQEEVQILKTFLTEGYGSFLKKYKKTKYMFPDTWMRKQMSRGKA
jgi:hypothetical protein